MGNMGSVADLPQPPSENEAKTTNKVQSATRAVVILCMVLIFFIGFVVGMLSTIGHDTPTTEDIAATIITQKEG